MSQNVVIALGLYTIGALLKFFYEIVIYKKDYGESIMETMHSVNDSQFSDKTVFCIAMVFHFFDSFLWPIGLAKDIKTLFKKEVQN